MSLSRSRLQRFAATIVCVAVLGPLPWTAPAWSESRVAQAGHPSCAFFLGQAYRRGIEHFATEMLWVCETIAQRRAARTPLGDRLEATEAALHRYRNAVVSAGRTAFAETRRTDAAPHIHGLSDATKYRLAQETGALTALAAVRDRF